MEKNYKAPALFANPGSEWEEASNEVHRLE